MFAGLQKKLKVFSYVLQKRIGRGKNARLTYIKDWFVLELILNTYFPVVPLFLPFSCSGILYLADNP